MLVVTRNHYDDVSVIGAASDPEVAKRIAQRDSDARLSKSPHPPVRLRWGPGARGLEGDLFGPDFSFRYTILAVEVET